MPMLKTVCTTNVYDNIAQLEVCRTFSGRGMGVSIIAHISDCKQTLLLCEPLPCNPAAETDLHLLVWRFES